MILQVGKRGESDIQDAACCRAEQGVAAIADGATDAALQALWAQLLVARACAEPLPAAAEAARPWLDALAASARAAWQAHAFALDLPWHGWTKVRMVGGLATLLVVAWDESGWRALAVGDCALLHVAGAASDAPALVAAFPFAAPADYTSHPVALSSLHALPERPGLMHTACGARAAGDALLLLTDALALWALQGIAAGRAPLRALLETAHAQDAPATFAALVEAERSAGRLRNDDCTLVVAG